MQLITRFVGGLHDDIQDRLLLQSVDTTDAINLATEFEMKQDRARHSKRTFENSRPVLYKGQTNQPQSASQTEAVPENLQQQVGQSSGTSKAVNGAPTTNKKVATSPYVWPSLDKCFRCGQPGHNSNQCPKRDSVNLMEPENKECDLQEDEQTDDFSWYDNVGVT